MTKYEAIKVFEDRKVRTVWDDQGEKWYFSIVDVIAVLTDSPNPRSYWKVLKHRLMKEGNQSVTNCNQLKTQSADGKFYKTDVASTFKEGSGLIGKWMTNKSTLEYLVVWEKIKNPDFNYPEFGVVGQEADANRFIMSVEQWVERTKPLRN